MPYINLKTTASISAQQEQTLADAFTKSCSAIGKPEMYVMLGFEENCRMHFGGVKGDCAYIEVNIYGSASKSGYDKLTALLTDSVCSTLGLPSARVYVKYSETPYWGFGGSNL